MSLKSGEVIIKRRATFCAAHRLQNDNFPDSWNQEMFGKCNSPNWHGHNYTLEVEIAGVPSLETGFVADLSKVAKLIEEKIVSKCDHKNLNIDVPFLKDIFPTAENLTIAFWNELKPEITQGRLYCVRIIETEKNSAEYYG
jgi:6-pyruvoyltetrahydropterin/6-carboxytetrahydropterin synthase